MNRAISEMTSVYMHTLHVLVRHSNSRLERIGNFRLGRIGNSRFGRAGNSKTWAYRQIQVASTLGGGATYPPSVAANSNCRYARRLGRTGKFKLQVRWGVEVLPLRTYLQFLLASTFGGHGKIWQVRLGVEVLPLRYACLNLGTKLLIASFIISQSWTLCESKQ